MSLVSICGGGGKTTICNKHPTLFIDIDTFVWSNVNKGFHKRLEDAVQHANIAAISTTYGAILTHNRDKMNTSKIILAHHPINAEWLNINHVCSMKPNRQLHENNIQNRSFASKVIARNCWENLKDAIVYNSHEELEQLLLSIVESGSYPTGK